MSKKLLFNFNREVIQNYTYVKYAGTIITATNTLEKPIKSAILKGSTKYRDIDTGEFLETFEEGRNLELVSVKMPVLKATGKNLFDISQVANFEVVDNNIVIPINSGKKELIPLTNINPNQPITITLKCNITQPNGSWTPIIHVSYKDGTTIEKYYHQLPLITSDDKIIEGIYIRNPWNVGAELYDVQIEQGTVATAYEPYKSNILTVNEDVTLRSNGSVYDELDLLTGKLTQRIDENGEVLSQEIVKTVDLSILDQNENKVSLISSFNDTTYITASGETIPPIFEGYLATKEVE